MGNQARPKVQLRAWGSTREAERRAFGNWHPRLRRSAFRWFEELPVAPR